MATATGNEATGQSPTATPVAPPNADFATGSSGGTLAGRLVKFTLVVGLLALIGYGAVQWLRTLQPDPVQAHSTFTVQPDELVITVTEDGNIESGSNTDIKCQVAGGSSILWIVEDGKEVQEGDKLVELDASALEDQINSQKIVYNKARTTLIQAQKDHQVALISVDEYLQGTLKQELETADTNITIAEENLRSAQNALDYSERMFQRGYISELELESQQFAVKRAQLELNSANTAKEVLEKFTKVKTLEDLQSQVETAEASVESEQAAFNLEEAKLKRLETQLENCTIVAPHDGMVVYANERSRFGQQSSTIEEGAVIRERQTILRLPDLSAMQVKVKVHESRVEDLSRNMRARINIQGRTFQGVVTSIANQPEPTSWFQGEVKEYATIVRIDGEPEGLKPGMTAEVEILISHLTDVLTLPVSAVVEQRGGYFAWARTDQGEIQRRPLMLGMTNDEFVEIRDGVVSDDEIIRNPRAVVAEAQVMVEESEGLDVSARFGETTGDESTEDPTTASSEASPERAAPAASPAAQAGGGPPARGGGRGGRGPGGRSFNLMQFDKDGDGKISKDEAPGPMAGAFDRMDGNQDGFIDSQEIAELRKKFGGSRGGGGGGGRPEAAP